MQPAQYEMVRAQRMLNPVRPPTQPAPLPTPEQQEFALATATKKVEMLAKRLNLVR